VGRLPAGTGSADESTIRVGILKDISAEVQPGTRRRRGWLPLIATVILAALLALLYYGLTTQRLETGIVPPPNATAPDFSLTTFDGQTVHLADLRGKPVVVNFWASWCVPCQDEQPTLQTLAKQYQPRGVVFIGVDIQDTRHDALGFLQQYGVTYPEVVDPTGAVYINYGVVGVPETYLISRSGTISQKIVGPVDASTLAASLGELLR
jgi:cytochrome c biogenesis protein CcmG/thiol:disulfide interchange protein DsbE